jgi:hypothetical protein
MVTDSPAFVPGYFLPLYRAQAPENHEYSLIAQSRSRLPRALFVANMPKRAKEKWKTKGSSLCQVEDVREDLHHRSNAWVNGKRCLRQGFPRPGNSAETD